MAYYVFSFSAKEVQKVVRFDPFDFSYIPWHSKDLETKVHKSMAYEAESLEEAKNLFFKALNKEKLEIISAVEIVETKRQKHIVPLAEVLSRRTDSEKNKRYETYLALKKEFEIESAGTSVEATR